MGSVATQVENENECIRSSPCRLVIGLAPPGLVKTCAGIEGASGAIVLGDLQEHAFSPGRTGHVSGASRQSPRQTPASRFGKNRQGQDFRLIKDDPAQDEALIGGQCENTLLAQQVRERRLVPGAVKRRRVQGRQQPGVRGLGGANDLNSPA